MKRRAIREHCSRNTLRFLRATLCLAGVIVHATSACAAAAPAVSAYPTRPIRFIVPNGAGGTTDLVARAVAPKIADRLGQQVVIDNRPGSGGIVGTEIVAKAAPDGHTLLMGTIGNIAISPALYRKLGYDPLRDFAPVTQLASAAYMLLVHPALSAKSPKELVALAKAKPGTLNVGSAGSGTGSHLTGELFQSVAGVKFTHVPYKGSNPGLTDLIAGQLQLFFNGIPSSMPHYRSGRLRALAVTTPARVAPAPELPTMDEAGFPGAQSTSWTGILVPAGTPAHVVATLNTAFVQALQFPEVIARLTADGAVPVGNSAAAFDAYIKSELVKWARVVKTSGAVAQ
jgi:tripartite-type tricarboxylate transporter receptor subunit TctC